MKRLTLILMAAVLTIASSCSKEKKITKSLWKPEGTWTITASGYGYYSMGTYNTSTSSYEDSLTVASGNYNGSTFVFEKFDNSAYEGNGTFNTTDTTINFTYFVSEKSNFGGPKGEFELSMTNAAPVGGTTTVDIYDIVSYDETSMSLKKVNNSGWSTIAYDVTHSYITIDMSKP